MPKQLRHGNEAPSQASYIIIQVSGWWRWRNEGSQGIILCQSLWPKHSPTCFSPKKNENLVFQSWLRIFLSQRSRCPSSKASGCSEKMANIQTDRQVDRSTPPPHTHTHTLPPWETVQREFLNSDNSVLHAALRICCNTNETDKLLYPHYTILVSCVLYLTINAHITDLAWTSLMKLLPIWPYRSRNPSPICSYHQEISSFPLTVCSYTSSSTT